MPEPLSNEEREALAQVFEGWVLTGRQGQISATDARAIADGLLNHSDWLAQHDAARVAATEQRVREEIIDRLLRAEANLVDLIENADVGPGERKRLDAKIQGVRLARGYVEEDQRIARGDR